MKRWILRRMFERTDVRCYFPKLRRLLRRPFRRGEGWGEGLLGVVNPAVLAVSPKDLALVWVTSDFLQNSSVRLWS